MRPPGRTTGSGVAIGALALLAALPPGARAVAGGSVAPYRIVGDAIPAPLSPQPGDPARGRAIVTSRQAGLCLLCHSGPFPEETQQGTLAPSLAGAGTRWTEGQLRLRIVDSRRVNPATLMPSYHRVDGLSDVAAAWRGKPILDAQQVEDVVALLRTLR